MVFEHIENLKRIYTDQLVVVDNNRSELGRFQGLTGTVRTVNMSGRALVEFDGNNNIGWYDIDVDFLKLVDQPIHETETVSTPVPPAETPAAETPTAETTAPAEKPAPAKVETAGMNVADMLAAARASAAGDDPTPTNAPAEEAKADDAATAEVPAEEAEADEVSAAEAPAAEEAAAGNAQALKEAGDVDGMLQYCKATDG